ncbi:MAG: lysophospholipid acyltransferase family protein [Pseudomonadota bacterium]
MDTDTQVTEYQPSIGQRLADALAGAWFIVVFVTCCVICLICTVLVPGLARRQRAVNALTRVVFWLAGMGPRCDGIRNLPTGPCVMVANHASYLDGIVMTAVLPPRFSFVIKAEMNRIPLVGFVLRRIDSFFVDRSHAARSASSARQIIRAARAGRALGFFPEGTFTDEPGLRAFRKGAFAAAKAGKMPIVPVVINGTRHILPADRWLPRAGTIRVSLLAPIDAGTVAESSPEDLSAIARQRISARLAEPDLQA